jgi:hypothetical protein
VYGEAFIDTVICVTQRKLGHCQNQTRLLKVEKGQYHIWYGNGLATQNAFGTITAESPLWVHAV